MLDYLDKYVTGIVGVLAAGFIALIKTVFTNRTQIEILKKDIADRAKREDALMKAIETLRTEINDLKNQILDIWKSK